MVSFTGWTDRTFQIIFVLCRYGWRKGFRRLPKRCYNIKIVSLIYLIPFLLYSFGLGYWSIWGQSEKWSCLHLGIDLAIRKYYPWRWWKSKIRLIATEFKNLNQTNLIIRWQCRNLIARNHNIFPLLPVQQFADIDFISGGFVEILGLVTWRSGQG